MRPPQDEICRRNPLQAAGIRSRDQIRSKEQHRILTNHVAVGGYQTVPYQLLFKGESFQKKGLPEGKNAQEIGLGKTLR